MADFHNTLMGKKFYQNDVPELVKQLTRIADVLEKEKNKDIKEDEIGNSFSAVKTYIQNFPNDTDLGKQIRAIWS